MFFNNTRASAYTEANARSVFTGGSGTNNANNLQATSSPITTITRGASATPNGLNTTSPVTFLDPTPANDALLAVGFAPNDGFFTAARFRGAFPRGNNWLAGWTATAAYGMTPNSKANQFLDTFRAGGQAEGRSGDRGFVAGDRHHGGVSGHRGGCEKDAGDEGM